MRRTLAAGLAASALALGLAAWLAPRSARSQAPTPARPAAAPDRPAAPRRGPLHTIYASDFGDSPSNADNRHALRAAIDRASRIAMDAYRNEAPILPKVTVFVQAGTHVVSGPINVPNFVELKGEGGSTKIAMAQGRAFTPVVVGMALEGTPAKYRPDLFGQLDATAARAPGRRFGLRTHADGYLTSPASAFSHGGSSPSEGREKADRWFETRKLTVDFAVAAGDGGKFPGGVSVFGLGSDTDGPATPFAVRTDAPNVFTVVLSTQAERHGPSTAGHYTFSTGDAVGLQRIAFQLDMDRGTVAAFGNGAQLALTGSTLKPGLFLNENRYDTFFVGNPNGSRGDFMLGGLCLTRAHRYADRGPGKPQARADGRRIADGPRFFPSLDDEAHCIGYLWLGEPDPTTRHLAIVGGRDAVGGLASSAYFLQAGLDMKSSMARITDIAVQGNPGYGYAIMMGGNFETHFDGVVADAGIFGIGNLPLGANYPVHVRDCTLSGGDSGYFGYMSLIDMDTVTFTYNGRAALRLVGCSINARGLFVPRPSAPQYAFAMIHAGEYGGLYSFRDVTVDNEGDVYSLAGIYCERHVNATTLHCDNVNFGTNGAAPAIRLKGMNPYWKGQAMLDATRVYASGSGPLVWTDDGQWAGTIVKSPANVLPAVVSVGAATPSVTAELPAYLTTQAKPTRPPSTDAPAAGPGPK